MGTGNVCLDHWGCLTECGGGRSGLSQRPDVAEMQILWSGGVWNGSHVPYMSPVDRCNTFRAAEVVLTSPNLLI